MHTHRPIAPPATPKLVSGRILQIDGAEGTSTTHTAHMERNGMPPQEARRLPRTARML